MIPGRTLLVRPAASPNKKSFLDGENEKVSFVSDKDAKYQLEIAQERHVRKKQVLTLDLRFSQGYKYFCNLNSPR